MDEIVIAPLSRNDFLGVRAVDKATQIQYLGTDWERLTPQEQETHLVSRKKEFNLHIQSGLCFVASRHSVIVGFIFAYEAVYSSGSIFIQHIAINPDFQAKGIGVLLLEALIEKAKKLHCHEIRSLINIDNPQSIKLHQKVGFLLADRKEATYRLR